jgi:predicted DCC family thiol-disulfide oxidoreductase YuxK
MASLTVIYDGHCGLCTRSVAVLRRLDWLNRLDFMDANHIERVHERFPSLPTDDLLHEIHIVNPEGQYWVGFYGFRRLAWLLPLLWPAAPVLYVPGVPWVGARVYGYVAAHRARNLCDSDACLAKHGGH